MVADQQRLTQAVMNLAENAVRHTDPDDAILLGTSLVGDRARLGVRDEGPGIDPADQERIFDADQRGEGPGEPSEGSGLGARDRGGDRRGARRPGPARLPAGLGATFTVVLPATEPPAP